MIILGISSGHDANICILSDGRVLLHVEKERLTRKRYDAGSMEDLLPGLLRHVGLDLADVDMVSTSIPVWSHLPRTGQVIGGAYETEDAFVECSIRLCGRTLPAVQVAHHLGHVAYSYFLSPFESADILSLDAGGNFSCGALYRGESNRLSVRDILSEQTLGILWCAIAMRLFGHIFAAGRVMGLAPYGTARFAGDIWRLYGRATRQGYHAIHMPFPDWERVPEFPGLPTSDTIGPIDMSAFDAAASVQRVSNEMVLDLLRSYGASSNPPQLCLGGGLALNCVTNALVRRSGLFDRVFVGPAPNDSGLAVGFALFAWHCLMDHTRRDPMNREPFLGLGYREEAINRAVVRAQESGLRVRQFSDRRLAEEEVVAMLKRGCVVGLYTGASESGPRALGHRSILADTRDPGIKDRINSSVKLREWFRPFAPAVLKDRTPEFFDFTEDSPYMSFAVRATDKGRAVLPATVHVDGLSRIQTVHRGSETPLGRLIERYECELGVPALLNTSLNTRGEPLCDTPDDATRTLATSGLDALLISNWLLTKR